MGLSSFPTFSFLVETVIYFSFPMKLAKMFYKKRPIGHQTLNAIPARIGIRVTFKRRSP